MRRGRGWAVLVTASLLGTMLTVGGASAAIEGCAAESSGGDWPSWGHDPANSRSQPLGDAITPSTAPLLQPKWALSVAGIGGGMGGFLSTPVVADGCIYFAAGGLLGALLGGTSIGAANADTGELVWSTPLEINGVYGIGVKDGRVHAHGGGSADDVVAIALDQATGAELWSTFITDDPGVYTSSSTVFVEDMVFVGLSGPEDSPPDVRHPGGYALLDAATGSLVKRGYILSEEDHARGFRGSSIWSTAVYDDTEGFVYAGTGQPANKNREHSYTNAIVKIDVRERSSTFGEIVDAYHATWDERADVDFGGSPNLFRDDEGNTIVGSEQKSGVYHAAFTSDMEQSWWVWLSDETALGNTATGAYDGESLFVPANQQQAYDVYRGDVVVNTYTAPNPGWLHSIDASTGVINWRTPVASLAEYHLVAHAGGVVYMVTTAGVLVGVDARNGVPVLARPLPVDVADGCANTSTGAVVARNMVYAVCDVSPAGGGWIVAYGLDASLPELPADTGVIPPLLPRDDREG